MTTDKLKEPATFKTFKNQILKYCGKSQQTLANNANCTDSLEKTKMC